MACKTCLSPTARLLAVGSAPAGFKADTTFDAAGLVVSPAWSTCPRACASRATNTRRPWNRNCRRLSKAASRAWYARPTPTPCWTSRPGGNAEIPRQDAEQGPRASAGRADHGLEGQVADGNGGTDGSGLHRLRAGGRADRRHHRAAARHAVREYLRLHRLAAPSGSAYRPRRHRPQRPAGVAPGAVRRARDVRNHRPPHDFRIDARQPRACTCAASRRRPAWN